jgi:hypothetical protein
MNNPRIEAIPVEWNDSLDNTFFAIAGDLFTRRFTDGATVLLTSNDIDVSDVTNVISGASRPTSSPWRPGCALAL